ncbi:MAG: hypothetical protein K6E76_02620 [Patescibacteria group bacterium]|nr:hypothetical protein [Patescibacteria group bacterium]
MKDLRRAKLLDEIVRLFNSTIDVKELIASIQKSNKIETKEVGNDDTTSKLKTLWETVITEN